ncbi:FAD-dependent oxidoreductase [Daejeonella lutea]|uniref:FAD dependent oxidoreductase n=1 Tax=Daejeonella lutea TaxID=572036 RepID=A0A1T5A8P8_9SPHI|nr:FAD-dependent oxidoreductase [Daejeonella lutea]SKB31381.1 FAD dependent oxidoreductase [Daejeonella lutea]
MRRRNFITLTSLGITGITSGGFSALADFRSDFNVANLGSELASDLVIAGGGVGGCAAALAALRNGLSVIMTEETDWIGGQLTSQGVPPDEHIWIETHGSPKSYRTYRSSVRNYYKRNYPVTPKAKEKVYFNPGNAVVSELCHEPKVSLAVLNEMLSPYVSSGKLTILLDTKVKSADYSGTKVKALKVFNLQTGNETILTAPYFADATEMGDLLPLTGTEFVTGTESRAETRELHAPEKADPDNHQAFTMCFAMDYIPGTNNVGDKPAEYEFWRNLVPDMTPAWPGKLLDLSYSNPKTLEKKPLGFNPDGTPTDPYLNLWNYRRILAKENFTPGAYGGDISTVNWPQNDYTLGNIVGVSEKDFSHHVARAKQLSLSLFHWLQTEAPRPDGKQGWPGLRLRKDIMGTEDGLAKYPYIREARRIKAQFTVLEEHVGQANRVRVAGAEAGKRAAHFYDSVGVGYYHIDLHPSSRKQNYIDFASLPFQIPLGSLLPKRMENLLPACKNIGTTHITNGCYRLHPVEWSIGEAVGLLVAYGLKNGQVPYQIRDDKERLIKFQEFIRSQGVETEWKS